MITRSDLEDVVNSQRDSISKLMISHIDCSGQDLSGFDFKNVIMLFPNFEGANLSKANLSGGLFVAAKFDKANLYEAIVCGADLRGATFREANLQRVSFNRSDLSDSIFHDADLSDAYLLGAKINRADFYSAKMSNAMLVGVDATNTKMCEADLSHANFTGALLIGTDMREAEKEGIIFSGANVYNLALSSSNLHVDSVEDIHNSGSSNMTQWEYKILTCTYPGSQHGIHVVKFIDGQELPNWKQRSWWVTKALNEFGKEGWELIEVIWRNQEHTLYDPVYILKRPLIS